MIPTKDTADFLKQSRQNGSDTRYNRATVTASVKLPPFAANPVTGGVDTFAKCWNKYGQTKYASISIVLDDYKKMSKENVEEAIKAESTDMNSILLLADRFQSQKGKALYTNTEQMLRATTKIVSNIILVD